MPPRPIDPVFGVPPASEGTPLLRFRGVVRAFVEGGLPRRVLNGVDMDLDRGEFVALLGPSGSGKSTLLNLASGIDAPDSGTVEVDGVRLHELSEHQRTIFRRDRIGFIFQFYNLVPTLTVEENLLLPLELKGGADGDQRERARTLLDRVGLGDRAGAWPDRLSGGEQQRVAVARALVHRPALVLADEPTGNLDQETGAVVLDLVTELLQEAGTTLLAVTHAPEVATRMDRVLRLRDGLVRPAPSQG